MKTWNICRTSEVLLCSLPVPTPVLSPLAPARVTTSLTFNISITFAYFKTLSKLNHTVRIFHFNAVGLEGIGVGVDAEFLAATVWESNPFLKMPPGPVFVDEAAYLMR